MAILIAVSFISGILTIFSPCVWPILPVVLSSSLNRNALYAFSLTLGIITTFITLTLGLSSFLKIFSINIELLRLISLGVITIAGLVMVFPRLSQIFESLFKPLTNFFHKKTDNYLGPFGGFINGVSLGILWTPCAGPILVAVAALTVHQAITASTIIIIVSYALGVALPIFGLVLIEQWLFPHHQRLTKLTRTVQIAAGIIMITSAILIYSNYDKVLWAKIAPLLPFIPKNITQLEEIKPVEKELDRLKQATPTTIIYISPSPILTPVFPKAPEITGIIKWFNTENNSPILLEQLQGKVVLLDFWTYTCVPCIPNIAYLKNLQQKYQDQGLIVVSVHTPGYAEAKLEENVKAAIERHAVPYPVAMDNDWQTFDAYKNKYWPTEYLIDPDGNIRYSHEGGGENEKTEEAVKKLLREVKH